MDHQRSNHIAKLFAAELTRQASAELNNQFRTMRSPERGWALARWRRRTWYRKPSPLHPADRAAPSPFNRGSGTNRDARGGHYWSSRAGDYSPATNTPLNRMRLIQRRRSKCSPGGNRRLDAAETGMAAGAGERRQGRYLGGRRPGAHG